MTYQPTADEASRLNNGPTNTSLWIAFKTAFPDAQLTSGMIDHMEDGGYHPRGMAVDIVIPNMDIGAQWIYDNYPHSAELIWVNGPLLLSNKTGSLDPKDQAAIAGAYGQSTLQQHNNHIHWASEQVVGPGGAVIGGVTRTGFFDGVTNTYRNVNAFFDALTDSNTWIRLGQILLGGFMILFAAYQLIGSAGMPAGVAQAVDRSRSLLGKG